MGSPIPNVISVADQNCSSLMASPGVNTRTRNNVDKLVASEKCRPVLDSSERIISLASSDACKGSQTVPRESSLQREVSTGDHTPTRDDNSDAPEDFSVKGSKRGAVQTIDRKVDDVPIQHINEDIVATQTSSGSATRKRLKKSSEATSKISKRRRTTTKQKSSPCTETAQESRNKIARAPSKSCQNLKENAKVTPETLKTKRASRRMKIESSTDTGPDTGKMITKDSKSSKRSTQRKVHRCRTCDKIFTKVTAYNDDQHFHVMGPQKCHLCRFETTYTSYMKKHFKRIHPGCSLPEYSHTGIERPDLVSNHFVCDFQECNKRFRRKENLRLHLKSHSKTSKLTGEKSGYKCPTCQKMFICMKSYKEHQRFHIMGKLKCHLCPLEYEAIRQFKAHFKSAHPGCTPTELPHVEVPVPDFNDRPFSCTVPGCSKSYRSKPDLQKHSKCHTGEKYKCTDCDFKSIWLSNLGKHKRKFHRDKGQEKGCAGSNAKSLLQFSETTSKKQNSNRTSLKVITKNSKLIKIPGKIKPSTAPSKFADIKGNDKDSSSETEDDHGTNVKTPPMASRPSLKSSAMTSKKKKTSQRSTKTKTKYSQKGFESSLNNKHKKESRENESQKLDEEYEPEPQIPLTPPIHISENLCAPEGDDRLEDENQVHGCPLCSRSFRKISKLDRHFQKKH